MGATVIPFPMTPLRQLRMELSKCHNGRMLAAWFKRFDRAKAGLDWDDRIGLVLDATKRRQSFDMEGRRHG